MAHVPSLHQNGVEPAQGCIPDYTSACGPTANDQDFSREFFHCIIQLSASDAHQNDTHWTPNDFRYPNGIAKKYF
jgi:hypothetical protein